MNKVIPALLDAFWRTIIVVNIIVFAEAYGETKLKLAFYGITGIGWVIYGLIKFIKEYIKELDKE